ncbi:MAG: hypothetical protein KDB23_07810 [Planctomycetales bacterium]|nr:hypothetical protein [Planctomycetales bacterium]
MDATQIELIVREVMRQLQTHTPLARAGEASPSANSANPPTVPLAAAQARGNDATTLVLEQRLITAESLRGRLDGITCLQVSNRTIITPLVNDLLRERKIRLERNDATSSSRSKDSGHAATSVPRRRIALYCEPLGTGAIWQASTVHNVDWISVKTTAELIKQINRQQTTLSGVAITRDWAKLLCDANRLSHVRATIVWSTASLQEALTQINPNLLVIDANHTTASDVDAWLNLALQR